MAEIIEIPTSKSSYLRMIIGNKIYDQSFTDMQELRQHFARNRRHLAGELLPSTIFPSKVVATYGDGETHRLLEVSHPAEGPMYYLVIGPIDHLWDKVFHSPEKAAQFAEVTAEKYDQSSGNT